MPTTITQRIIPILKNNPQLFKISSCKNGIPFFMRFNRNGRCASKYFITPIINFIKIQEAFSGVSSVYNRNNVTITAKNVKKQNN